MQTETATRTTVLSYLRDAHLSAAMGYGMLAGLLQQILPEGDWRMLAIILAVILCGHHVFQMGRASR